MTREDIVNVLVTTKQFKKSDAQVAVATVFTAISQALVEHQSVTIPSFGKFEARFKESRYARNPQTGEMVQVPEKHVIKFSPALALRESVK